jgi:aerobic carbon-monoxide dehydrogenase medium subunit
MFPAKFEYHAPSSLDEAIKLLSSDGGDAKILAGGHSLLPLMKLRLAQPSALVDIGRIPGLSGIKVSGDAVTIGALTTHAEIEASQELEQRLPLLPECAAVIGDLQVRNRGTIGGSLAHADPAGDFPAVILALDAEIKARGPNGERTIKAADFFVDMLTSALEPNEILTEIRIPLLPPRTGTAYLKMDHPASHYALCGVAAVLTLADGGTISDARVGITGVAPRAYRASEVEQALKGQAAGADTFAKAAEHAADGQETLDDLHASSDYRAHLARVYARRALEKAAQPGSAEAERDR